LALDKEPRCFYPLCRSFETAKLFRVVNFLSSDLTTVSESFSNLRWSLPTADAYRPSAAVFFKASGRSLSLKQGFFSHGRQPRSFSHSAMLEKNKGSNHGFTIGFESDPAKFRPFQLLEIHRRGKLHFGAARMLQLNSAENFRVYIN
jgi:hypothetical protein